MIEAPRPPAQVVLPQPSATPEAAAGRPGWAASLRLKFGRAGAATRLVERSHRGPLQLQKLLFPEGPQTAHGILLHPPGGIAGGDSLDIGAEVGPGSHVFLTTPGATKWYRANGRTATQTVSLTVAPEGVLEYFPQENIVFDGARGSARVAVDLEPGATFAGWEITCLGRPAGNQPWRQGAWQQSLVVTMAGRPVYHERMHLVPGLGLSTAAIGLADRVVQGSLIAVAGPTPPKLLAACQAIAAPGAGLVGVSALPEVFTARYLGECTEEARAYFEAVWNVLRPWYADRPAQRPRIWAT